MNILKNKNKNVKPYHVSIYKLKLEYKYLEPIFETYIKSSKIIKAFHKNIPDFDYEFYLRKLLNIINNLS